MYDDDNQPVTTCMMPKEVYEDRYSFLAHWNLFHILKEHYRALCQLTVTDTYRNKIQSESSEIKPYDCKKLYLHHGFEEQKAPNYMYIIRVGGCDRVEIKCKAPEYTHARRKVPTTFTNFSNRLQTSKASQQRAHTRGKSTDTHTSDANVNIPSNDDSNLAKKFLRISQDHLDVSVHSTETSKGPESISILVRPIGGTLNEWCVYMRHYSNIYGGSVGTNVTAKGVYSEIDLRKLPILSRNHR